MKIIYVFEIKTGKILPKNFAKIVRNLLVKISVFKSKFGYLKSKFPFKGKNRAKIGQNFRFIVKIIFQIFKISIF